MLPPAHAGGLSGGCRRGRAVFGLGDYPCIIAALCSPESPPAPGPAPGQACCPSHRN